MGAGKPLSNNEMRYKPFVRKEYDVRFLVSIAVAEVTCHRTGRNEVTLQLVSTEKSRGDIRGAWGLWKKSGWRGDRQKIRGNEDCHLQRLLHEKE